jgi:lipoprotein-anchoring transpeptidase ErfK/SrfK
MLMRLGIPTGTVDGIWDERTRQGFCAWRELSGYEANRNYPSESEKYEIVHTQKVQPAANNVVGVNVNKTCQTAVWIKDNSRQNFEVFIVSTGMASAHVTDSGDWKISWRINRWHESTIYPDGWMYWPMYFSYTGAALHGSESDEMVRWYPASHGCVRMLHADIDKLWAAKFGVGDNVKVYGKWSYVVNDPVLA